MQEEWKWTKASKEELAKFVNRRAIDILRQPDLSKFNDRKEQVRAIYDALVAREINYDEEIHSEPEFQIIRTPHQILGGSRQGTCLDLALLFCGLCLGYRLLPLLIIIEGHAFVAVSLKHSFSEWNQRDDDFNPREPKLFTNLEKLKELIKREAYIAIECTGFAHTQRFKNSLPGAEDREDDGTLSFDNALIAGRDQLENTSRFQFAIDIVVAHRGWGITPLSIEDRDMDIHDELENILDRIGSGVDTFAELERLKQIITATGTRLVAVNRDANEVSIVTGDTNVTIDILFQGNGFQVTDRKYTDGTEVCEYTEGAEVLRSILFFWQKGSHNLLKEKLQQLTTNPLTTQKQGIRHKVEDVYVPLGLFERKKQPIQMKDISPEQGSDLGREIGIGQFINPTDREAQVEITKEFKHDEFLNEVFLKNRSPESKGKRIAIIGEPGAGKTTLLQKIAKWIEETFPSAIVIWVSLADLKQDKKLDAYLEEEWLEPLARLGGLEVSTEMRQSFTTHVHKGEVWLLLDGLDEMQAKENNLLSVIQQKIQTSGWAQQMRIVMTCRLNRWDVDWNELERFDTYRTLNFDYPQQVEEFIEKWFAPPEVGSILQGRGYANENGKKLCKALEEAENERIRDLMRNPLRLSLMCYVWSLEQGKLPETQAELYERFVDLIYKWKDKQFPTTPEQRRQLNQKLAELSRAAIDDGDKQGKGRFRLREDFVEDHLVGSIDRDRKTFFDLAVQLGWLNNVGLDADNSQRSIYAFFHPTFQEYFAALGIDDDRFFLTLVPKNGPLDDDAKYRVFERQWRQVFLLWLGRKDKDLDKERKEALIQTLWNFQCRCSEIYTDRAFLLAAIGIAEFKDCSIADKIVDKLVQWKFSPPDPFLSRKKWEHRGKKAAKVEWATNTFSSTDSQRLILSISRVLATTRNYFIRWGIAASLVKIDNFAMFFGIPDLIDRWGVAASLVKIDPGNEKAIHALVGVTKTAQDYCIRWIVVAEILSKVAEIFFKIGIDEKAIQAPVDEKMIPVAVELLKISSNKYRLVMLVYLRWINIAIDIGSEKAIKALVELLATTEDDATRWNVALSLGEIGTRNETAIKALVELLATTKEDDDPRWKAVALSLRGIDQLTAIKALVRMLATTQDDDTRRIVAPSLLTIWTGNERAIKALEELLEKAPDDDIRRSVEASLVAIDTGNERAIKALVELLETTQDDDTRRIVAASLVVICTDNQIDPGNERAIKALEELLEKAQDDATRRIVAASLGQIDTGNERAIKALEELLEKTQDDATRVKAIVNLFNIGTGKQTAIKALEELLEKTQDDDTRWMAAANLGQINPGNKTAIKALEEVLEKANNHYARWKVAERLGQIDPDNETAIQALVKMLEKAANDYTRWNLAASLGQINPGNERAIKALVEMLEKTQDDDTRRRVVESLDEIGIGNQTAIKALEEVLEKTQDDDTRRSVAASLNEIGISNEAAIKALVKVLEKTKDDNTRRSVAASLGKISIGNEKTMKILVRYLPHKSPHKEAYILMMKCADLLSYRDFYQAFHPPK